MDLLHFDYLLDEQTQILSSTTNLSGEELVKTARRQALIIFNTTFGQNIRTVLDEKERKDEVAGTWEIRDGKLYAEGWGTLETLLERAKEDNPETYDEHEARAMLRAQDILVSDPSIRAVAYSMYHQSGTRYIPVMERTGNTVAIRSVDIGILAGRNATTTEGADVIKMLHKRHGDNTALETTVEDYPVLVMSKPIQTREIQETAMSRVLISEANTLKRRESIFTPREIFSEYTPKIQLREQTIPQRELVHHVGASIVTLRDSIHMPDARKEPLFPREAERIQEEPLKVSQSEMKDQGDDVRHVFQEEEPWTKRMNTHFAVSIEENMENAIPQSPVHRQVQKTKHKEEQQKLLLNNQDTLPVLTKELSIKKSAGRSLVFIEETGVGLGAAPVLLGVLARELPVPLRPIEKSIARHQKKEMKKTKWKERRAKVKEKKRVRLLKRSLVFVSEKTKQFLHYKKAPATEERLHVQKEREIPPAKEQKRKKRERMFLRIREHKAVGAVVLLYVIRKTSFGASMIPFLLDVLVRPGKKRILNKASSKESIVIGSNEVPAAGGNKKEKARKKRKKKRLSSIREVFSRRKTKRERKVLLKGAKELRLRKKRAIERLVRIKRKNEQRGSGEERRRERVIILLSRTLIKLSKLRKQGETNLFKGKKKEILDKKKVVHLEQKKMSEHSLLMIAAFLLWIMVGPQKEQKPVLEVRYERKRIQTVLEEESRFWLLLAIVWYLAKLREGRSSMPVKQQKKKKKKKSSRLPQTGVIYHPAAQYL